MQRHIVVATGARQRRAPHGQDQTPTHLIDFFFFLKKFKFQQLYSAATQIFKKKFTKSTLAKHTSLDNSFRFFGFFDCLLGFFDSLLSGERWGGGGALGIFFTGELGGAQQHG